MQDNRNHWPEYLMEAFGLGMFMFVACAATALLEHPASALHQGIESAFVRRIIMGAAMGVTALALIMSPWGQRSGAHLNPSVTLTFWALGKVGGADAILYVLAQFAGGLAGTGLASFVIGMPLDHMAVGYAATTPSMSGSANAFAAEAIISFLLMTTVLGLSNSKTWYRSTPYAAAVLVALFIIVEAPVSGMSMNPARTFASAVPSGNWQSIWIYFLAPPLGMLLAAAFHHYRSEVHCAKLHHANTCRCIFRCEFPKLLSKV
ncbi:MAG: aquaporin family protein [Acidobacteria bacterium]|nr:aquaporin family protein [Acidobacteriota bacterium]